MQNAKMMSLVSGGKNLSLGYPRGGGGYGGQDPPMGHNGLSGASFYSSPIDNVSLLYVHFWSAMLIFCIFWVFLPIFTYRSLLYVILYQSAPSLTGSSLPRGLVLLVIRP